MSDQSPFEKLAARRKAEKGVAPTHGKVQELMDNLKKPSGLPSEATLAEAASAEVAPAKAAPELPAADRSLLEKEISLLQEKLKKAEEDVLRILADSENFKKRIQREKQEHLQYANEKLIKELVLVYDHLEMTLEHAREVKDPLVQGVEMVLRQFQTILEKFGVSVVEEKGETFDPHHQESIGVVETKEYPPDTVVEVKRKGFLLHNRLIRPALVTVAKGKPE